ncbi:hypothetical protein TTHT_0582 [Thermotomaculum hydrothermale]|uniref:PilZ domain-containing protein n=1 Tax=Thermotomaculum hydrothermale TaxID=981385 RepID=A0A7R6PN67_9BACT|nr:PilZ domain-containing protein [Thermotomaculum hydrothermale]BBB32166.1 hypothetical protein TTHT_0582 [Thermotomaculum hydrothermale]
MDNFKNKLELKQLKIPISIEYSLDQDVEILPVSFLSMRGMFAETTIDYPIGANVVVRFYLPQFDKVVEAVGEIVEKVKEGVEETGKWNVPGIFIKFKAINTEDREYLESFLKENAI